MLSNDSFPLLQSQGSGDVGDGSQASCSSKHQSSISKDIECEVSNCYLIKELKILSLLISFFLLQA